MWLQGTRKRIVFVIIREIYIVLILYNFAKMLSGKLQLVAKY